MTMGAQWAALRHDRKKEESRRKDEQKALAWAIFFKIKDAYEGLTSAGQDLIEARASANAQGLELWQVFQAPVHDLSPVQWTPEELVLLVDHRQLDLMQRYQMATIWLANLIQSLRLYRDMRIEFLSSTPSQMQGNSGTISVNATNQQTILPRVGHLRSLSDSLEAVVHSQQPDARQLLIDYAAAMKPMIGTSPELVLP